MYYSCILLHCSLQLFHCFQLLGFNMQPIETDSTVHVYQFKKYIYVHHIPILPMPHPSPSTHAPLPHPNHFTPLPNSRLPALSTFHQREVSSHLVTISTPRQTLYRIAPDSGCHWSHKTCMQLLTWIAFPWNQICEYIGCKFTWIVMCLHNHQVQKHL